MPAFDSWEVIKKAAIYGEEQVSLAEAGLDQAEREQGETLHHFATRLT